MKHADVHCCPESVLMTQRICSNAVPWLKDSRQSVVVASITSLLVLATVAVILRVVARRIAKVKFGIDDWLIGVALVSYNFVPNIQKKINEIDSCFHMV